MIRSDTRTLVLWQVLSRAWFSVPRSSRKGGGERSLKEESWVSREGETKCSKAEWQSLHSSWEKKKKPTTAHDQDPGISSWNAAD